MTFAAASAVIKRRTSTFDVAWASLYTGCRRPLPIPAIKVNPNTNCNSAEGNYLVLFASKGGFGSWFHGNTRPSPSASKHCERTRCRKTCMVIEMGLDLLKIDEGAIVFHNIIEHCRELCSLVLEFFRILHFCTIRKVTFSICDVISSVKLS